MESVAEQLTLLDDLNDRQDAVLAQLAELNQRLETLLEQVTGSKVSESPPVVVTNGGEAPLAAPVSA